MSDLPPATSPFAPSGASGRSPVVAAVLVWVAWGIMVGVAVVDVLWVHGARGAGREFLDVAGLAAAAAAFIVAVRRVRGRTRFADGFFPLVLLNSVLYTQHGHGMGNDRTLLATALLGLMAGAIIAMRRDNLFRYFAVAGLAIGLAFLAKSFLLIMPALVAWFLMAGFLLARSEVPRERVRGFVIMALGEVGLLLFGIACILEKPAAPPPPSTLFSTIVNFTEFPLLVIAIVMLGLGWRKGPRGVTPPHFAGMLALLVGLLVLLLNNFQSGQLPGPGADQTVLILCLVYTVFTLHGPRRLQWIVPPALLIVAGLYTAFS